MFVLETENLNDILMKMEGQIEGESYKIEKKSDREGRRDREGEE